MLPAPAAASVTLLWSRHLLAFMIPLTTTAYLATSPHPWPAPLLALLWFTLVVEADRRASGDRTPPPGELPRSAFEAQLHALFLLHLLNVGLMLAVIARGGLDAADLLVTVLMAGVAAGATGITVAHELVHHPARRMRTLGRIILGSLLYEHFYTEHLRGHHARVGTREDPATARFGERFRPFFRRTLPGQFRSAWRLETARLGDAEMPLWDRRLIGSRVVHGLLLGWAAAFGILALLGPDAFAAYLLQAIVAIRLLEAVNYFEHWGLERRGKRVEAVDSWDAESWFSRFALVGLSRHADHHAAASRPYQELRVFEESPKLPMGYFGMAMLTLFASRRAVRLLTRELERQKRGPFAERAAAQRPAISPASARTSISQLAS